MKLRTYPVTIGGDPVAGPIRGFNAKFAAYDALTRVLRNGEPVGYGEIITVYMPSGGAQKFKRFGARGVRRYYGAAT